MSDHLTDHLHALQDRDDAALGDIVAAADRSRESVDGSAEALRELDRDTSRPPLIADVPVDELPPYVPPAPSIAANALIPDTPLVDSSLANGAPAFDDAPLWQS